MIRVLVVEDDFRVAQVHVDFIARVDGFTVAGTARTAADCRAFLAVRPVDLVLLDSYLPDEPGLGMLAELTVDTIVLTAASDAASVRLARGALNYLVKPFTAEQLGERLTAYRPRCACATAPPAALSTATAGGPSAERPDVVGERPSPVAGSTLRSRWRRSRPGFPRPPAASGRRRRRRAGRSPS
jgi:DNA-binding response OmpR family regulator